jgi:hypothetical protein
MACEADGFGAYQASKVLKIREDAQSKSMSIFGKVEHLRPNHPRMTLLEQGLCFASRYLNPNQLGDPGSRVGKGN